jgi:hypothetical protein
MVILLKFDVKSWWKINLKSSQNYVKNDVYKMGLKIVKNDEKMTSYKLLKKVAQNWFAMGGSKIDKNRLFSIPGTRTPRNGIFWNFALFCKSSPLFDPQNRPQKGAL